MDRRSQGRPSPRGRASGIDRLHDEDERRPGDSEFRRNDPLLDRSREGDDGDGYYLRQSIGVRGRGNEGYRAEDGWYDSDRGQTNFRRKLEHRRGPEGAYGRINPAEDDPHARSRFEGGREAPRREPHFFARDDREGPHRGRGPAGFKRSDERVQEEICHRLEDHSYLDASGIEVRVTEGEAQLSGEVESREAKRLAERIAEGAPGVADVHNHLTIRKHA